MGGFSVTSGDFRAPFFKGHFYEIFKIISKNKKNSCGNLKTYKYFCFPNGINKNSTRFLKNFEKILVERCMKGGNMLYQITIIS